MIPDGPERREQRHSDLILTELCTRFDDFLARYERDVSAAQVDRTEVIAIIKAHDEFIRDIKPLYSRSMVVIGVFVVGSIGIATHWLWRHINFG